MKNIVLIAILAAFLSGAFAIFGNFGKEKQIRADLNITCDLNRDDCAINGVKFSFYPKPLKTMVPLTLKISGLNSDFKRLNARIYGLNMDMGTIRADLEKIGGIYSANVVISSCVVSMMNYRLELFDGDRRLGIFIDFELKM